MSENRSIQLKRQLTKLGFGAITDEVELNARSAIQVFTVYHSKKVNNDFLMYSIHFEKADDKIRIKNYELTMQSIVIPKTRIHGIDTTELEVRMLKADNLYNDYLARKKTTPEEIKVIESGNRDLNIIFESGGLGREIAQLFMFKYWPENEYQKFILDAGRLRENYQVELLVEKNKGKWLSASEAYNEIKKSYTVPKIKGMNEEHVISDKLFEQAQFELSFGRNWIAYNSINYFLDKEDVYFFKLKDEAIEFSDNNISEFDDYKVIQAQSIHDFLRQIPYGNNFNYKLNNFFNQKTSVMNQENLSYLKDSLKYLGFGDKLYETLEQKMKEGKPEFQLNTNVEFNKKSFEATLNFRKSDSSEMYFFNNYHASLEKSNGEKVEQTFYLNKGKGVTAKEAFNLLDGRAVHKDLVTKEGQPYKAWMQLDFENKDKNNNFEVKQFHEKYGFDLKAAVEKFAIAELNDPEKEKTLMQSLQKGNVQSVTIEKDGSSHKMFIEADPQFKKVTMYDSNMKMVAKESLEQYKAGIDKGSKTVKEDMVTDKKKDLKQEFKPDKQKAEKKNDKSLLPKKRESNKKGLGVS